MKKMLQTLVFGLMLFLITVAAHAATITVTNINNAGAGSLRQALADAVNGDTINFSLAYPNTIYLSTQLTLDKSLTIEGPGATKLSLSGNSTVRVLFVNAGTSTISGLTFTSGRVVAGNGAGIYVYGTGVVLTLDQCIIKNNTIVSSSGLIYGGGICNHGSLTLNRCWVQNNQGESGGGLASAGGTMTVYNSTFSDNVGSVGSAIYTWNGTFAFTNVTIVNNQSTYNGAFLGYNSSNNTLTNCTITQNTSTNNVAGLYGYYATIVLRNTVVAANVPGTPGNTDIFFDTCTLSSLGYNLIGSTGSQTYTWDATDQVGTESSQQAANLQSFGDNGGYVRTCLPGTGSPLIDPLSSNSAPWVDARGYLRVNTYDMGAAEYGGTLPVATAATSVGTSGFTANWDTVTGAEGYALDIAMNSSFNTMVSGWGNSLVGNTTSWNVTGLSSGTTYYYRVRASNGVYLTHHSNTITVTTLIPTATSTVTLTVTETPTSTASPTTTPTFTTTPTVTETVTPTMSPTITMTSTITLTVTDTSTITATTTPTATPTISATGTHTPTASPTVTVSPTTTNSPTMTVTSEQVEADLKGKSFIAYPNPARDQITFAIAHQGEGEITINIYNMNSEQVVTLRALSNHSSQTRVIWNCSSVAPSLYVVRVMQGDKEIGKSKVAVVK